MLIVTLEILPYKMHAAVKCLVSENYGPLLYISMLDILLMP